MLNIQIKKQICTTCNRILQTNTCWYFENDNIFCSKSCRKMYRCDVYNNNINTFQNNNTNTYNNNKKKIDNITTNNNTQQNVNRIDTFILDMLNIIKMY